MTLDTTLSRATARVATPKASQYLQTLCKHFGHRRPVTFDKTAGEIAFDGGTCRLAAEGEVLTLTVEAADPAERERLQEVIASHLLRFAFKEQMTVSWTAV